MDGWSQESPERFRLFVELWAYAQRDEHLARRLAERLRQLRATFARFASQSARDAGFEPPPGVPEQFANVMLGLGVGLSMLKLVDPDAVPAELLGTTLSVLIRGDRVECPSPGGVQEAGRGCKLTTIAEQFALY